MKDIQKSLENHIRDLMWSLWTELGIPGATKYHSNYAIDPEALITWSGLLYVSDPKLRDLIQAWSQQYNSYISMSRLRSLHKISNQEPLQTKTLFTAQTEKKNPSRFSQTIPKHIYLLFNQPATIVLRCRALFGVSARSDMIVRLLFNKEKSTTATKLAQQISLTKLNVGDILHDLQKAGLCVIEKEGNTNIYYLTRTEPLRDLIAPWPTYFPLWKNIFSFLSVCIKIISTSQEIYPEVAATHAHKDLLPWVAKLKATGLEPPTNHGDLKVYWNDISHFILKIAQELAHGTSRLLTA